ncbi:hypothetical protein IMZ68_03835 [Candidatus Bathyarchaeota archaeon]|nr:hypothetical protein [Candidatus Bathyarchaeota archaeon]
MTEKSKFKTEKIIGYILLTLGIILLLFSIVEMFSVYGGTSSPPKLINLSDISLPGQDGTNTTLIQGSQLSQLPNLFFWFVLMSFVLFAGGKIASLGVSMLKDIKVEVKQPLLTPNETEKIETEEAPTAKS